MDKQSNSTTAPAVSIGEAAAAVVETVAMKRKDAKALEALRDLENEIFDLASMAQIMGDLLDNLTNQNENGSGTVRYDIPEKTMSMLWFTWHDVIKRTTRLEKAFSAAYHGRAAE
ncbi:hypothetical protein GGQ64_002599 [Rhizobium azooxidifex]|uniref:Uncharacterized protein n=1 Tax=Mycoplana azooxidifex TaxID=1636188 RepID=A0A7W6D613_9HYPH|nr:hypothetical protein [Mycoplana azooxidifex]MBB3977393.1 hypothetical protein [Mycoplana azooxidifex]